jgi:XTP/dITP diphosphohydrolase
MHSRQEKLEAFGRLLDIMDDLREKCPWDQKQTFESLRYLTIEETYELADAIVEGDLQDLKKEIGDILLHMVFYSKIASESNEFDIADVLHSICEKLIHRHPHIYGDVKVANEEEVKANWEKLKLKEGKKSVLEGVPKSLPSMVKAARIQEKARGVGFDWDNKDQVWDKVKEELAELTEAEEEGVKEKVESEFGDVLFALINYGRFLKVDPEMALERTNKKFIKRFQDMEAWVEEDHKKLSEMSLDEMDEYWERSKRTEQ